MKTSLLIIIIIGIVAAGITIAFDNHKNAYGLWVPRTTEELFQQSETIFVGTIQSVKILEFERSNEYNIEENGVSKIIIENYTQNLDEYTVNIEEFLKNPQEFNTITMLEATVGGVPGRSVSIGGFELGDRVLFYVPKIDGTNQYSPESFLIPENCDAKLVLEQPRITNTNDFRIMQDGVVMQDNFTANKKIQFVFDKDTHTLDGAGFNVNVVISKILGKNERQTVLEESIHVESKPCEWITTAKWDFIPTTAGEYAMWISYHEDDDTGYTTGSSQFSVVDNKAKTFYDLYYENDLVVKGTVISFENDPLDEQLQGYNIKVIEQYSKPQQTFDLITAFVPPSHEKNSFDVGDTVLLYLNKLDARYMTSPYSFKVHQNCKDMSFTGLQYLPWEGRPRSTPTGTHLEVLDMQGSRPHSLEVGTSYSIKTDKFWHELTDQLDLEIVIKNLDLDEIVLQERKTHSGNPCDWKTIQWLMSPDRPGQYFVLVTKHEQLFADRIIRPTIIQTAKFTVGTDDMLFSATSSTGNLSLIEQLRFEIPAEYLMCNNEKTLVFKKSNNSPACIKPENYAKLIMRGWASVPEYTGGMPTGIEIPDDIDVHEFERLLKENEN